MLIFLSSNLIQIDKTTHRNSFYTVHVEVLLKEVSV